MKIPKTCLFRKKTLDLSTKLTFSAKFVPVYVIWNSTFWNIENTAICHISVALNISFGSKKGFRETQNCQNCNFQMVWAEWWSENCFLRQSLTKYVKTNLWNQVKNEFYQKFNSWFCSISCILPNFNYWSKVYTKFWKFPEISLFPKILRLNSFGNSWGNLYLQHLVIIILLHFTCGAGKLC